MNLLKNNLKIIIPIVSRNYLGSDIDYDINLIVTSNGIRVGEVNINTSSTEDVILLTFPNLSPKGELQYFTLKFLKSFVVNSITYNKQFVIESTEQSIAGEEYSFDILYSIGAYELKHTYTLDCPQDYVVPLYTSIVNTNVHAIIEHGSYITLYTCNMQNAVLSTWYIDNVEYIGNCITLNTILDKIYTIVVDGSTTLFSRKNVGSLNVKPTTGCKIDTDEVGDCTFSIGIVGGDKVYSLFTIPNSAQLLPGNATLSQYINLISKYVPDLVLDNAITTENGVNLQIQTVDYTVNTFDKDINIQAGQFLSYTGSVLTNLQPCSKETNFQNTVNNSYLITTPAVINGTWYARNSIVLTNPSVVDKTSVIVFGTTTKEVPVLMYKLKLGFSELVKYSLKNTLIGASSDLTIITFTLQSATTKFIDLSATVIETQSVVLQNPDLVSYTMGKTSITFKSQPNSTTTITYVGIDGNTHTGTGVTIIFNIPDGVFEFTIVRQTTNGSKTQILTLVKTVALDEYYTDLMLHSKLSEVFENDSELFLTLRVLINLKKEVYLRTGNTEALSDLTKLLTKFNTQYVSKF